MPIAQLALRAGNAAEAPVNIIAFGAGIMDATRVIVRGDYAAARNVKPIDNDKAAGRDYVRVDVKGNRFAGMPRQVPSAPWAIARMSSRSHLCAESSW